MCGVLFLQNKSRMLDANPKLYTVCDTAELLHKALSLTAQGTPCKSVSKSLFLPSLPSSSFFYLFLLFLPHFSFFSVFPRLVHLRVCTSGSGSGGGEINLSQEVPAVPTAGCWDAKGIHSIALLPSLISPQKSQSAWANWWHWEKPKNPKSF